MRSLEFRVLMHNRFDNQLCVLDERGSLDEHLDEGRYPILWQRRQDPGQTCREVGGSALRADQQPLECVDGEVGFWNLEGESRG